uniref:Folate receptor alpha n=1 Tax=Lygus hesperus TaxID=30085 RepID=A0A0A9XTZ4_LYGHE
MYFSMNTIQILAVVATTACLAAPDSGSKSENYKCMDTPRHKATPSPETQLHKACSAYEGLSCCTNNTAIRIHGDDLYKFQNVVCKNKELSPECKKYFLKDACFYECSPDLSPYFSNENGSLGLKNVPLCQSNCDSWFAACQNDFTCIKDWKKVMDDTFTCSANDKCQTIKDKFQNAKNFCEKVWDSSYEVVPDDDEKCLRFDVPLKRNSSDWRADDDQDEKNSTDGDCHKSSSSSVKYHIILGGVPFVLSYYFLQSKFM